MAVGLTGPGMCVKMGLEGAGPGTHQLQGDTVNIEVNDGGGAAGGGGTYPVNSGERVIQEGDRVRGSLRGLPAYGTVVEVELDLNFDVEGYIVRFDDTGNFRAVSVGEVSYAGTPHEAFRPKQ
jgi:hypothetical protein